MDGPQDIATEAEAQDYLASVQDALVKSREILDRIPQDQDFQITPVIYGKEGVTTNQILTVCSVAKRDSKTLVIKDCPWKTPISRRMNFADVRALKLGIAASLTYSSIFTSYKLNGSVALDRELKRLYKANSAKSKPTTAQDVIALIKAKPELAQLRDGRRLTDILGFGAEMLEALEHAVKMHQTYCPAGGPSESNRPGYLFETGFCAEGAQGAIDMLRLALRGPVDTVIGGCDWRSNGSGGYSCYGERSMTTTVNSLPLLQAQIGDLKDFLPTQFNSCGEAVSLPDNTLRGIYPKGDIVEVIRINAPWFLEQYCHQPVR